MKTRLMNIATLDMRGATEESVAQIESIANVATIIVSPRSKALLAQMDARNVANVVELPEGAELVHVNGEHTLTAAGAACAFLSVNGTLVVDPGVEPEDIGRLLCGAKVNGNVLASAGQMAALVAAGMKVNGNTLILPEGVALRRGTAPLTEAEAAVIGASPYLMRRTVIEPGACARLAARGLALHGDRGAIVSEAEAAAFYAIWRGSGAILIIPDGYRQLAGPPIIGRRDAMRLRGKVFVEGRLILREDVDAASLAALESLAVTGELVAPTPLMLALMDRLATEPELLPYEGTLMLVEGEGTLTDRGLDALGGRVSILAEGVLSIAQDIDPEKLRAQVALLQYEGVVEMTDAQHMALLPVIAGEGEVSIAAEGEKEEAPEDEADVHVIRNAASYIL